LRKYIARRAVEVSEYIIQNQTTVRETAKVFGISKSSIHKDATSRIMQIDTKLARAVAEILKLHFEERHIRGGEATRQKYLQAK